MKTLGIKFEVAGIKEAQSALTSYKNSLNQSLQRNKQAAQVTSTNINNIAKENDFLQQRGEVLYDYFDNYQRTLAAFKTRQYKQGIDTFVRPRANTAIAGTFDALGGRVGERIFDRLEDFGRKLIGIGEYNETINLSDATINKLLNGRTNIIDQADLSYKKQTQREINARVSPKIGGTSLSMALVEQITLPIKTIQYSFYEAIGSYFGSQFATGLDKVISEDLDVSFERKGQVTGKAISYTATSGFEELEKNAASVQDSFTKFRYAVEDGKVDEASQKFDDLFKKFAKTVSSLADSYVRGFRKGSVEIEALRKIAAEIANEENDAPDLTGKKKLIIPVGGFAGDSGKRGNKLAAKIKPYVDDETEVIGADNSFTDTKVSADKNGALWGINAMANVAKINLKGFNPDSVKLAAKVIAVLEKYPNLKVDLVGHSAGGFVVEEAQEILNLLGRGERVKSTTVGTPNVRGGLNTEGVNKIMGEKDPFNQVEQQAQYLGITNLNDKTIEGVQDHSFDAYLNSDEFLKELLGDSLDQDKKKAQQKNKSPFKGKLIELETLYARYISSIYQDLDELGDELSIAPDRLVAKTRRGKLRDRGGYEVERKLREKDFKPITVKPETQTAVLISGGFAGAQGRSGALLAREMNKLVDDGGKTEYKGIRNPFTDVFERDEELSEEKSLEKVVNLFSNVSELGYNPDAAEIAAQVIDLLDRNPNLKVKIGGYSGAGYPVEDVTELLKSQGADMSRVQAMGIGTPDLPGGIRNREFKKLLGANDNVFKVGELKKLNEKVKAIIGFDIFPELMSKLQNIPNIDDHSLNTYVENSKEVQDFFYGNIPEVGELLKNRNEIEDLKEHSSYLGGAIDDLQNDETLDPQKKLARLNQIKQEFIDLLTEVHSIAKYSEKIGGGRYFKDEAKAAAAELKEAGIEVEERAAAPVVPKGEKDPWAENTKQEQAVVNQRSKALALEYKKYLQNLIRATKQERTIVSQVIARDFAISDPAKQKELLTFIKQDFTAKAKAYRQAVKTGQLELAKEQGQELLKQAESIKSLYRELSQFDQLDPEVKGMFASYSGYITTVQNEVVSGTGGKGRINQGLPDIFEGQLNAAEQEGGDFAEGFVNGILETLVDVRQAGREIIDEADRGVREQGEIQSPSRLAQRLGRWFARGFGLGMSQENLDTSGEEMVDQAETGIIGKIKNAFAQLKTTFPFLARYQDLLFGIAGLFLGGMGIGFIVGQLNRFGQQALDTAMAVESLNKAIIVSSRDFASGIDNLEYVSQTAKNLSIDLNQAKQAYAGLIGAAKDTPLEGQQTERIFNAFAEASANRGVDVQGQERLFTALSQIIGKRKLQAEEVKGQIGDIKGFGDFQGLIATALGVSTPQLAKMMEQGEVGIDVLPKVAALLEAQNAAASGTQTALQAQTKYNNSLTEFMTVLGQLFQPLQKFWFNLQTSVLDLFSQKLGTLSKILVNLAGVVLLNLFGQVNVLKLAVTALGQVLNAVIFTLSKLWAAKFAIIAQALRFVAGYALIAAAIASVSNVIKLSKNHYQDLLDDVDKLTAGMERFDILSALEGRRFPRTKLIA